MELDQFTQAYVACALWSTNGQVDETGGDPLGDNYSAEDFDHETLEKMVADCARFESENAADIATGHGGTGGDGYPFSAEERAGHDFWLTRNGHGAGFWDGDWPEPAGTRLTDASKAYGEFNLYVGDDGKIYT